MGSFPSWFRAAPLVRKQPSVFAVGRRVYVACAGDGLAHVALTDDADDLVPFQDVRVIETSGSALLCRIGNRTVWLPRRHISGKLWCRGDRGKLFVRRWLARDLQLIDQRGEPISPLAPSIARPRPPGRLHPVR